MFTSFKKSAKRVGSDTTKFLFNITVKRLVLPQVALDRDGGAISTCFERGGKTASSMDNELGQLVKGSYDMELDECLSVVATLYTDPSKDDLTYQSKKGRLSVRQRKQSKYGSDTFKTIGHATLQLHLLATITAPKYLSFELDKCAASGALMFVCITVRVLGLGGEETLSMMSGNTSDHGSAFDGSEHSDMNMSESGRGSSRFSFSGHGGSLFGDKSKSSLPPPPAPLIGDIKKTDQSLSLSQLQQHRSSAPNMSPTPMSGSHVPTSSSSSPLTNSTNNRQNGNHSMQSQLQHNTTTTNNNNHNNNQHNNSNHSSISRTQSERIPHSTQSNHSTHTNKTNITNTIPSSSSNQSNRPGTINASNGVYEREREREGERERGGVNGMTGQDSNESLSSEPSRDTGVSTGYTGEKEKELIEDLKRWKTRCMELERQNTSQRNLIDALKIESNTKDAEIARALTAEMERHRKDAEDELRREKEMKEREREKLQISVQRRDAEVQVTMSSSPPSSSAKELERVREELSVLRRDSAALSREYAAESAVLSELQREVVTWKSAAAAAETEKANGIKEERVVSHNLRVEIEGLKKQLIKQRTETDSIMRSLEQEHESQMLSMQEDHSREIQAVVKQIRQQMSASVSAQKYKTHTGPSQAEIEVSAVALEAAQLDAQRLTSQIESLQLQLRNSKEENNMRLEVRERQARAEMSAIRSENTSLEERLVAITDDLNIANSTVDSLTRTNKVLEQSKFEAIETINKLKTVIRGMQSSLSVHSSTDTEAVSKIRLDDKQREINEKEREIEDLRALLLAERSEMTKMKTVCECQRGEIEDIQHKLEEMREERRARLAVAVENTVEKKSKIYDKIEVRDRSDEVESLRIELQAVTVEAEEASREYANAAAMVNSLEKEIAGLKLAFQESQRSRRAEDLERKHHNKRMSGGGMEFGSSEELLQELIHTKLKCAAQAMEADHDRMKMFSMKKRLMFFSERVASLEVACALSRNGGR